MHSRESLYEKTQKICLLAVKVERNIFKHKFLAYSETEQWTFHAMKLHKKNTRKRPQNNNY